MPVRLKQLAQDGATDGQVVTYSTAAGEWEPATASGGWSVVTETTAARSAVAGEFVLVDVATCAVTLPAPAADVRIAIKAIAGTVTDVRLFTSGAGVLIDGTDYSTIGLRIKKQYEQISVVCDGADWFIY